MSTIEKRIKKFYRKPVPNNITLDDAIAVAKYFGCIVKTVVNHGLKIVYISTGTVIPIPVHGKYIGEAYVEQLKKLFDSIKEESGYEV